MKGGKPNCTKAFKRAPRRRFFEGPEPMRLKSAERPRVIHLQDEIAWHLRAQSLERALPEERSSERPSRE